MIIRNSYCYIFICIQHIYIKINQITFYDSKYGATAIQKYDGEIKIEYEIKNITISQILVFFGFFLGISLFKAFVIMPFIDSQYNMVYL